VKGPTCGGHDHRWRGGHHGGHRHGGGGGAGREHHRLLLGAGGQHGGGDQLGQSGVVVRLGQDVGHKVGARGRGHDDHLEGQTAEKEHFILLY